MSNIKSSIMIVEDESYIKKVLETALAAGGYRTISAVTGAQARSAISSYMPDMVLLDLGLPDMEGVDVIKKVRTWSNVPIIVISARSEDVDKIEALDAGADDYITKPFSPSELVARVKAHLNRYQRLVNNQMEANDIIEIRGLKIDKTARRVYLNGEEKVFTTKEFDLLTFLAGHPNRVFTKEELFNKIWDMESLGDIATVTVHIKKIREKIEVNTAKPQYIETIWGVGYRFKM